MLRCPRDCGEVSLSEVAARRGRMRFGLWQHAFPRRYQQIFRELYCLNQCFVSFVRECCRQGTKANRWHAVNLVPCGPTHRPRGCPRGRRGWLRNGSGAIPLDDVLNIDRRNPRQYRRRAQKVTHRYVSLALSRLPGETAKRNGRIARVDASMRDPMY